MKNLRTLVLAFAILIAAPFSRAADLNNEHAQPDRNVRMCGPELSIEDDSAGFDEDSDEEFRARISPGVDEVQERNDDETDALDPGTF